VKILGLDISTSCTGWCIIDHSTNIVDIGYIDTSKIKSIFEKSAEAERQLSKIFQNHEIEKIYIEENLQSFRSGFSSAATLSTLSRFNGIVSFICFKIVEKIPEFLNVNTARKTLGIKLIRKKDGGLPTKEQLFLWAEDNVDYPWPRKKIKSGPRKNMVVVDPRSYDMIDAYVVARAGQESCKK
jgi:Holliday junction resolvasome RuvABC endonuclease subunit